MDIGSSRPHGSGEHAQVLRLNSRLVGIGRDLGLGRPHPERFGYLFSRVEEQTIRDEVIKRREAKLTGAGASSRLTADDSGTDHRAVGAGAPPPDREVAQQTSARSRPVPRGYPRSKSPTGQVEVVYEDPYLAILQVLKETELELHRLAIKIRTLSAIVMARMLDLAATRVESSAPCEP